MNLQEALKSKQISWKKAEYFKWKHDIKFNQLLPKKTEEQFLKTVELKTFNSFIEWERTTEYKQLLVLLLDSKIAEDMQDIYAKVTEDAKTGDDKAVKLFLSLQKEIASNAKKAQQVFKSAAVEEDDDDTDDLILD